MRSVTEFLKQLWNRRVVQFGTLYLGAAWLLFQVAIAIESTMKLPDWVDQTTLVFLVLGFPVVLIFAWAQESRIRGSESQMLDPIVGQKPAPPLSGDNKNIGAPNDSHPALLIPQPLDSGQDRQPAEPLLAVLPFDNLSSEEEMQFFSDGVSEEILGRITRGSKLKVVGRTSSFQFRGAQKPKAAAALNVTHVLDGSIRRASGRVRITAHLVDAAQQTTLWSNRYDRDLEDIFAVQDEISEAIADALHQTFDRLITGAANPAVYDLYLRASPKTFVPDELRAKVSLLEDATRQGTEFAAAWGRLAFLRSALRTYEPYSGRAESSARVAAESERALAQDPQNVDALAAQYFLIPPFGQFVEAELFVEQMQRTPGLSEPKFLVGIHFVCTGRAREACRYNERLFRNDPLNLFLAHRFAVSKMTCGHYDEAVSIFEEILAREPDLQLAATTLVRAHAFNEDWAAVDKLIGSARQPLPWFDSAEFVHTKRDPSPANIAAWQQALVAQFEHTGCVDASQLAQAAHLGLVELAYAMAETACFGPPGTSEDITDPDAYRTAQLFHAGMPELRNDLRFVKLSARLGLVEFWLKTDKWPDCVDEVPYDFKAECDKAKDIPKQEFAF